MGNGDRKNKAEAKSFFRIPPGHIILVEHRVVASGISSMILAG